MSFLQCSLESIITFVKSNHPENGCLMRVMDGILK